MKRRASPSPGVLHIAAECSPFARTGGLAEAVANLARFQARAGHSALVVLPLHHEVAATGFGLEPAVPTFPVSVGWRQEPARLWRAPDRPGEPRVYFVEHAGFFDRPGVYGEGADYRDNHVRFAFLAAAALQALPKIAPTPLVLHAHDWHAAFGPLYLRTRFAGDPYYDAIPAVLTVHNVGFQGIAGKEIVPDLGLPWGLYDWRALEWHGRANVLKGGVALSDAVTTVSARHAWEITTPEGGFGLHQAFAALGPRLTGILSGIDQEEWDPERDPYLAAPFSARDPSGKERCKADLQRRLGLNPDPRVPLVCQVGRLAAQKGIDLLLGAAEQITSRAQLVVLGSGEARYEWALRSLAASRPGRVVVDTRFADEKEHRILAGADIFLMPSQYEPCGLTQMRAQRYGTIPVGRKVGGIADAVEDGISGFLFDGYAARELAGALERALERHVDRAGWRAMMAAAMSRDFGWQRAVLAYDEVYRRVRRG